MLGVLPLRPGRSPSVVKGVARSRAGWRKQPSGWADGRHRPFCVLVLGPPLMGDDDTAQHTDDERRVFSLAYNTYIQQGLHDPHCESVLVTMRACERQEGVK